MAPARKLLRAGARVVRAARARGAARRYLAPARRGAAPAYPVARLAADEPAAAAAVPVAYPLLGVALHAYGPTAVPTDAAAPGADWDVDALRKRVAASSGGTGRIVVHAMPDAARDRVDAWGPLPPAFALMRNAQRTLRPARTLQSGSLPRRLVVSVPVTDPKAHDPQSNKRSYRDLIADCVHCGFCLPACPTYNSWGEEMDSPRGRIDLMKGVADGIIPLDDLVTGHIDACLGCMGCVTACPSGVRYDLLIEATRAKIEEQVPRSPSDRAFRERVRALPVPRALARAGARAVAGGEARADAPCREPAGQAAPPRLRQLATMAPPLKLRNAFRSLPARVTASGERRARVGLVAGCVQRTFFPGVNDATLRVLSAEGCEVVVPRGQGCCGALSLHSGRDEEAKRFAKALIERFEGEPVDAIVINAAGCGSTLKEYGELFADDPAWRRARRPSRPRCATSASTSPRSGRAHRATSCRSRSPTTTLATSPTRSACACSRASSSARSPGCNCSRSPRATSAAAAPAPTTCSSPRRRTRSGCARSTTCRASRPT